MWDSRPPKVLVAVDSADCEAVLQFAVAEVARRGCGLHLVHVARPALFHACALDDVCLVEDELRLAGHVELEAAAERAQGLIDERSPDDERLSISTELTHGSVVGALQALSRHAGLLVMEHHGMGVDGETASLSVTAGVAAVAHCPVVAVPDHWRPHGATEADVVVGIEDPVRDVALFQAAVAEARRRDGRLRVLVVPSGDTAVATGDLDVEGAGLPVDIVVGTGSPAGALLHDAQDAGLLVVGRHHRRHVVGATLGRTARALLRESPVPVLVLDPAVGDGLAASAHGRLAERG